MDEMPNQNSAYSQGPNSFPKQPVPMPEPQASNNFSTQPSSQPPIQPSDKKNNKTVVILGCIIAILVIALIVVTTAFIIHLNSNSNGNVSDNKKEEDYSIDEDDSSLDTLSNNWRDYNFSINNKILSLPLSYKKLSAVSGFAMKETKAGATLPSKNEELLSLFQNDKVVIYANIVNNSDDYLTYSDCQVNEIWQDSFMLRDEVDIVTFPGGFYVGMTVDKDTLYGVLGEADDVYVRENSERYIKEEEYSYFVDAWHNDKYRITVTDGVISAIMLAHY